MKLVAMIVSGVVAASGVALNFNGANTGEGSSANYEVDTVHSSVLFGVKHMSASRFYGRFNKTTGHFTYDESDPARGKFEIEIDANSVDTAFKGRDEHLMGPDFFNVKQFPTIMFKSKSLQKKGDGWKLKGDLTLHGKTNEIEADFEWIGTGEFRGEKKGGFEATFEIKRTDYGMSFMTGPLGDNVKIIVSLEGNQK
jgi:polyisoprenoid-binding protein YceI